MIFGCFWTMVLEKSLESPLYCKEIKPINPKGDQSWIFIGRTDAEAETPILWPPAAKSWLTGKDPNAGKDWRWEKKGTTEDEMVGWHHQLNGHGFGRTAGVGDVTGRPGVLLSVGSQRVRHDWATELNWADGSSCIINVFWVVALCFHHLRYLTLQSYSSTWTTSTAILSYKSYYCSFI